MQLRQLCQRSSQSRKLLQNPQRLTSEVPQIMNKGNSEDDEEGADSRLSLG